MSRSISRPIARPWRFAECGRALPERRLGEIWLKGPCVSPGYFLDAETTAKHFRRGWHKSFDLGFVDGGELYVLCRQGDLIKIGGASLVPEGTIQRTGSGKKRRKAIADRFLRGEVSTLMPSGLKPGSIPSVEDDAMPV